MLVVILALTGTLFLAVPARAHVAIRVLIISPNEGERVGPDTDVRLFAQPFLGGVDQTTFSVELDGGPLDPASGQPAAEAVEVPIRVEEARRIPLASLAEGSHTLTVTYRPDLDEAPQQESVTFVVGSGGTSLSLAVGGIAAAVVALVAALAFWIRKRRRVGA